MQSAECRVQSGPEGMAITAIAPWFGAKRFMADVIVAELGAHVSYFEPFCGSMAVLMRKPPARMETVNDLHGDLVNLARVVRDPTLGPMLYRRLRRTLMAKGILEESARVLADMHDPVGGERGPQRRTGQRTPAPEKPDLERAYHYFVCAWMGRNGVAGTHSYNNGFCARYTKSGGTASTRWGSAVNSIPAWRRRLAGVTIDHRDGFEMLEKIEDAAGVAVYLDPPYVEKGATYVHDFDPGDHARLAALAGRFGRSRVVISYYDHAVLRELYSADRWTFIDCSAPKAMVNQGRRDGGEKVVAPEVLIVNGPAYSGGGGGLFG